MSFTREELHTRTIGVLLGGLSAEREVSERTGAAVVGALKSLGYDVVAIDPNGARVCPYPRPVSLGTPPASLGPFMPL